MKTLIATLKLFNAIRVIDKDSRLSSNMTTTIPYGFVVTEDIRRLADRISANETLLTDIKSYYLSTKKANRAFHKSWQTIKNTPQEELWLQAIVHYFTTYGYEALGIGGEIYIPREKLDLSFDINLIKVVGLTDQELIEKIINLSNGVALAEDTLEALVVIIEDFKYKIDIDKIKNRELKSALYDLYDIVPQEPVEYLRFVVSRITGETLLIKSKRFIEKIRESNSQIQRREVNRLIDNAPINLAEIFFRYKPIFLALKSISSNKSFFNRLRKQADLMHKPLPEDYLNSVTSKIKRGDSLEDLESKLETASIFRKIRLANALKFRLVNPQSIVYKIRNGRSWVDDFVAKNPNRTKLALDVVLKSMKINKTIYVPEYIDYGLPATEKQFIGNIPANTKISVDDNLIIGIYWENVNDYRIDLDFSSVGLEGKVGWDANYKSSGKEVLFSGDMTNAKNGASELMYFGENNLEAYSLFLNYYNFNKDIPVPSKIFVAHEKPINFNKNYVANNIIVQSEFMVKEKQLFIGVVYGNSLYLSSSAIGESITSGGKLAHKVRQYLFTSATSSLRLSDVLNVVNEEGDYPNLSPEKLDKNTIIELLVN